MELIRKKLKPRVIDLQNLKPGQREQTVANGNSSEQPYVLITSSHDILKFDRDKSVALCIGIDEQLHQNYAAKSLKNSVVNDVEAMGKAFNTHLGLNFDQVRVQKSSAQPRYCTKKGIRDLFVESATQVKEDGIFIFYFAGHGILIRGDECVLAPADFAGKEDLTTGISGQDLVEWLHVADCEADYVLIILDCCYAGDLGTILTSIDNMSKIKPCLYVMCGCAARETSISIPALGHSIFTYFFLQYLNTHHCLGQFAIKEAMDDIAELCLNFSSLVMNHDGKKLQPSIMNPILDQLDVSSKDAHENIPTNKSVDETDSGRFELVFRLLKPGHPKPLPHRNVENWLKSPMIQNALSTLYTKVNSTEELQEGIFSALLYSAASIQYIGDKTHLEEENLFLTTVISVLGAIGCAYPEVNITIFHLITGLLHYSQAVIVGEMKMGPLNDLLSDMIEVREAAKKTDDHTVTAVSDEMPQQLCRLSSWEPLELI